MLVETRTVLPSGIREVLSKNRVAVRAQEDLSMIKESSSRFAKLVANQVRREEKRREVRREEKSRGEQRRAEESRAEQSRAEESRGGEERRGEGKRQERSIKRQVKREDKTREDRRCCRFFSFFPSMQIRGSFCLSHRYRYFQHSPII